MSAPRSRILVVDDNPRNLAIIQKLLGDEHRVTTAASGEQGVEIARRQTPDLVLLDIMMPGMDGYQACRNMRAIGSLRETKIILVSAKALLAERLDGYRAGADDYITKPFDHEEFQAKVRVYLRLRSLEEVNRLKTELLLLLAHETRTPLTAILGPLDLLATQLPAGSDSLQMVEVARTAGLRLNRLVEKTSELARLQAGNLPLELTANDLSLLVRDCVALVEPAAAEAGVHVGLVLAAPLTVQCDHQRIRTAVLGLLDNAIRFSPRGGAVEVAVTGEHSVAQVLVTDHGPGVAPGFLPYIFDGFAVPNIMHHGDHLGLTLATASAVVRHHDGLLQVVSQQGVATTFTLELPLPKAAGQPAPAAKHFVPDAARPAPALT